MTKTKKSIVFAHGLWADGSCFSKLIPTLQAEGHEVIAAQNSSSRSRARSQRRSLSLVSLGITRVPLMNATRATAEDLQPQIIRFVGSSGGGQWSFQLLCKFCTDLGTISAAPHSIGDAKALRKAAEGFAEQGWWIDGVPICPKCYKRKNT